MRAADRRALSTAVLAMLAWSLPLAIVLSSQLRIYCIEQGDCSVPERLGAWLLIPLIVVWTVAVLTLAVRTGRWLLTRRRGRARD